MIRIEVKVVEIISTAEPEDFLAKRFRKPRLKVHAPFLLGEISDHELRQAVNDAIGLGDA